jgi:hypothetical protein
MNARIIVSMIVVGCVTAWAGGQTSDGATQGEVTLLGTLAEWMYPGSTFGGGQMSDGGNRRLQSIKC